MDDEIKTAWETTIDNSVAYMKRNRILSGAIIGGAAGTVLFPIPVVGTLLGVFAGVKVAEKINEEKMNKPSPEEKIHANEKLKAMGSLTKLSE